jgi:RNA polymerase sigma-70 factor (TIGR02943 family)
VQYRQQKGEEPEVDPEAWLELYGDRLFRYARSRVRDAARAEELVQDVFLTAFQRYQQFSGVGSLGSWLMTILYRKIMDEFRIRERREAGRNQSDSMIDPSGEVFDVDGRWVSGSLPALGPEQAVELQELREIIEDCLTRVPARCADVFVMNVLEDMSTDEIGQLLAISRSNVRVRLYRARLLLAKCVAGKWPAS